jgi:hypothetical protein
LNYGLGLNSQINVGGLGFGKNSCWKEEFNRLDFPVGNQLNSNFLKNHKELKKTFADKVVCFLKNFKMIILSLVFICLNS